MPARESRSIKIVLILLYIIFSAVFIYYLTDGWTYYTTGIAERPRTDVHQNLKPGGLRGHGLGMVGSFMMILLLFYSVRKRLTLFRSAWSISRWLDLHILMGIMGPLFIILHSTLKLNGIVSISFWSMIAVALSGVLGRYIYAQIPRGIQGNELSLQEVGVMDLELNRTLVEKFSLDDYQIKRLQMIGMRNDLSKHSLPRILLSILFEDLFFIFRRPFLRRRIRKIVKLSGKELRQVQKLSRQRVVLQRRLILWQKIHHIFHNWHIIHKPFAIIMYLIMVVHATIAVLLGYRWIF